MIRFGRRCKMPNPYAVERRRQLKKEVLSHYGLNGELRCSWPGCLISDLDMLTLDHVNDDGCKDGQNRPRIYDRLKHAGYPSGFQTLCANHQFKKEAELRRTVGDIRRRVPASALATRLQSAALQPA